MPRRNISFTLLLVTSLALTVNSAYSQQAGDDKLFGEIYRNRDVNHEPHGITQHVCGRQS